MCKQRHTRARANAQLTAERRSSEIGFTMAQMFTISGNDSDSSEEVEEKDQVKVSKEKEAHESAHLLVPERPGGGLLPRQRNHSMNEEDLQESGTGKNGASGEEDPFRRRSRSAPPALWAAKKYGRQLRKMSDEFDTLLDKGMKRVRSAGAARQMHASTSWFSFLWSHNESETEASSSLTAPDTRPAQ